MSCTEVFPTHWSPGEFSKEVAKIPKNTNHLDLHRHHLEYVSNTELRESFSMLPPNVKILDLSGNDELTTEKLIDIFSVLPPTVIEITLNYMPHRLKDAFPYIPKSVHTLSLSYNQIGYKDDATESLIQSIPGSITKLILSGNHFVREDNNGLAIVMKALSPTVHTLSLHNNNFGNSTIYIEPGHKDKEMNGTKSLFNGLRAMPHTITSLDLSSTCLFYKNSYELSEIFSAISSNVGTLDLTH